MWGIYLSVFLQLPFSPTSVPHPASSSLARILPAPAAMTKCQSRHLLNNSVFPLTVVEAVKSKINMLTGSVSVGSLSVSHRLLALSSHARGPNWVLGLYNPPMRLHPLHAIIPSQRYHLLIPSYKVKFCLEHLKHTDMGLWQPVSSASSSLVLEHSDLSYVTSVGVAGRIRTGSH